MWPLQGNGRGIRFVTLLLLQFTHCLTEQAATNLKGILPIVEVDCTAEQSVCAKYGVQGYPTIKLFKNKKPIDYNGGRDAKSMVSFATSNIKSSVEKIKDEAGLEKFLAKNPSLPHLLLFSEKDPSTLYQALSMKYEGITLASSSG